MITVENLIGSPNDKTLYPCTIDLYVRRMAGCPVTVVTDLGFRSLANIGNTPDNVVTKIQNGDLLNIFVKKLKGELDGNLKKLILFGSRARGDNAPDSDYDCVAVSDNLSPSLTDIIDEIAGEFGFSDSL